MGIATCRAVVAMGSLICLASLALHAYPLLCPMIELDDFEMLVRSRTWIDAWTNLWIPANEHAMPLGRLSTAFLVQLAGKAVNLPTVIAWQGPLALLAALGLVYVFVRRELDHPFYGLVAMMLFGITSIYHQAVWWFAASFSVLMLVMLLLALVAAQRYRQTGSRLDLVACAGWSFLAPCWFASGVLSGPLCVLYLLPGLREFLGAKFKFFMIPATPLLGTFAFLIVSLPRTAERILHTAHYEGRTAVQAFQLSTGLENTARSIAENLVLGSIGIGAVDFPNWLVVLVLGGAAFGTMWLWRGAPDKRLLSLGLGLILSSYVLTYSARADWQYKGVMNTSMWGRYHLLPQLGFSLVLVGPLPQWLDKRLRLAPVPLSIRQMRVFCCCLIVLYCIHLPRCLIGSVRYKHEQHAMLEEIDRVDSLCRLHGISAGVARSVLPPIRVPDAGERDNGWELLRGSDTPLPIELAEVRVLLTSAQARERN